MLVGIALLFRRMQRARTQLLVMLLYLFAFSCGVAMAVLLDPGRFTSSLGALVLTAVVVNALWTRGRLLPLAILAWLLPTLAMLAITGRGAHETVPYLVYLAIGCGVGELLRRFRVGMTADMFVLRKQLLHRATFDPLTGVLNRAGWEHDASAALADAGSGPVALVYFDLDHFKNVNDQFGHAMGDRVLERAAVAIRAGLRENDPLARLGGEEFVALLAGADVPAAVAMAERARLGIMQSGMYPAVTVSAGVAMLRPGESLDSLTQRADRALLQAKHLGRNRVVVAAEGAPATHDGLAAALPQRAGVQPA